MELIFNSLLLGLGLSMDAFSISLANGLNEKNLKDGKILAMPMIFGLFQMIMPLIGWVCVHTLVTLFNSVQKFIPYIAFILLAFIGGKMILDCFKDECEGCQKELTFGVLIVQAVATSIDALSTGFTIAHYNGINALLSSLIIGAVTFVICFMGVLIGKRFGKLIKNRAGLLGGTILIIIGIKILVLGIM